MKKQQIAFGAWIAALVILVVVVNRMAEPPVPGEVPRPDPAKIQKNWVNIISHAAAPPRGPKNARYSVVEFGDFECPTCGKEHDNIVSVLQNPDVNLYFVHRPLPRVHKHAIAASQLAAWAAQQGKFWPMYDLLYSHKIELGDAAFSEYSKELGLNGPNAVAAIQAGQFRSQVQASESFCDSIGVISTPTLVVHDAKLNTLSIEVGPQDIDPFIHNPPWGALGPQASGPAAAMGPDSPASQLAKGQ